MEQIIRLVEEASSSKAPIARLADKVSAEFLSRWSLPIAVVTSDHLAAAAEPVRGGGACPAAIAVLVISCPCALGTCDTGGYHGRNRKGRGDTAF